MNSNKRLVLATGAAVLLAVAAWLNIGGRIGKVLPAATPMHQNPSSSEKAGIAVSPQASETQRAEQLSEAVFMRADEVEPLSVARLQSLLPEHLAGMTRGEVGGQRNEETGIPVTVATATYAAKDGRTLNVAIGDLGGPKGIAAYAGWALLGEKSDIGDDGYEKTYEYQGRSYYEKWDQKARQGEEAVLLSKRFVVRVSGAVGTFSVLNTALQSTDLEGVEKLH